MEQKKIKKVKKEIERKIMVPKGHFNSDWFECLKCGYEVRMLVRGDRATCSECGGTMIRK